MGKKSKKKSRTNAAANATVVSTLPSPPGASCYICLEEGLDESEQPIVRDCSCRENSGYAHLDCIVKYAEQKNEELYEDIGESMKLWETCPNCNQEYRNEVAQDLVDAFISFTKIFFTCDRFIPRIKDPPFPCDPYRYIEALSKKLEALHGQMGRAFRQDGRRIGLEVISTIENMNEYPAEIVLQKYGSQVPKRITMLEARAYNSLGLYDMGSFAGLRDEGIGKSAIKYFEKCRQLCLPSSICPDPSLLSNVEIKIFQVKQHCNLDCKESSPRAKKSLQHVRKHYNKDPCEATGSILLFALRAEKHRTIESQRLVSYLLSNNIRIHGPNHDRTIVFKRQLDELTVRKVTRVSRGSDYIYQALRYDNDGQKIVVQGPLTNPRNAKKEKISRRTQMILLELQLFVMGLRMQVT